jgi:hypothetical protein
MAVEGGPMAKLSIQEVANILYGYLEDPNGDAEVYHAMEHGVRSVDIEDPTLAAMWATAEAAFDTFEVSHAVICDWIHERHCPSLDHLH